MRRHLASIALAPLAALFLFPAARAQSAAPPVRGRVELALAVETRPPAGIDADVLVIPVFEKEPVPPPPLQGLSAEVSAALDAAAGQRQSLAEKFSVTSFFRTPGLAARRLLLIGAGEEKDLDAERLRRLAGAAVRHVRKDRVASMAFLVRGELDPLAAAAAAAEGAILGLYEAGFHKTDAKPAALRTFRVAGVEGEPAALAAALERAALLAHATNLARSIAVEPNNYMTPEIMAAHARAVARESGLEIQVFDEKQMAKMGMGGVLAVGKGSASPPRFIVLRYRPERPSAITLALAGKGVCFDSGGISLKDPEEMYRMKGDRAGGAAVLAAMKIIGRLKPAVNVIGVVPAVENIPGPAAQRPGDVYTGYSGKKIEVLNTDAEGRLILSDAVSYAVAQGATHVVDVATLTGAIRGALWDRHVGAFASDDRFYDALAAAARRTGEPFWRMPVDDEYARKIKDSLIADLNETGGEGGGASVGAKFIQQFTQGRPWIHLDIAGTSWPKEPSPWLGAGPTGVAARTLAELAVVLGEGRATAASGAGSPPGAHSPPAADAPARR